MDLKRKEMIYWNENRNIDLRRKERKKEGREVDE